MFCYFQRTSLSPAWLSLIINILSFLMLLKVQLFFKFPFQIVQCIETQLIFVWWFKILWFSWLHLFVLTDFHCFVFCGFSGFHLFLSLPLLSCSLSPLYANSNQFISVCFEFTMFLIFDTFFSIIIQCDWMNICIHNV